MPSLPSSVLPTVEWPSYYTVPSAPGTAAPAINPYEFVLDGYSIGELEDLIERVEEELIDRTIAPPFVAGEIVVLRDDASQRHFVIQQLHPSFIVVGDGPQVFYRACGEHEIYCNKPQNLRRI